MRCVCVCVYKTINVYFGQYVKCVDQGVEREEV